MATSAPTVRNALAHPYAIDWSLATPITSAFCPARTGLMLPSLMGISLQLMDAEADWRRAAATMTATAQDARRVSTESARLVRMIGTRAPSTIPAASA